MALLVGAQNMMSSFFGKGAEIASLSEAVIYQAKAATAIVTGRIA
jgi:hypothetical protein